MAKSQESPARLIRRYENRKLYDPAARRYVTLDDLAATVSAGEEVQVLDQKSGEDLTNLVLAQVVLEGVKEKTAQIPRHESSASNRTDFATSDVPSLTS